MRERIEELVTGEPEWSLFFEQCCESPERFQTSRQFRYELQERGYLVSPADLEDVLFDLARELCPDSPAARDEVFDEWARGILRKAVRWFGGQGVEGSLDSHFDALNEALLDRGRVKFRQVAREWAGEQVKGEAA